MSEQATDLIKEWVVNDYFTPNIKAEVILDTLLTPYIPQILKHQCKDIDAVFLTKEMSIFEMREGQEPVDNRGAKIDYVLADKNRDCVYLVELKTTDSSIDGDQLALYNSLAEQTPVFGDVLGKRLLDILNRSFRISLTAQEKTGDGQLEEAWKQIWDKRGQYDPRDRELAESASYEKMAMEFIKSKGWAWRKKYRSRKYLYTLGQLLDYLHSKDGENGLWNRRVEFVYLLPRLPEDRAIFSKQIRLSAFVPYFETEQKDTPLSDIINEIYGG